MEDTKEEAKSHIKEAILTRIKLEEEKYHKLMSELMNLLDGV